MKALNALSLLVVILVAADTVLAEREDPLQVFPQLKRSKKIIAGLSDFLANAQGEVLLTEEGFIQTSIKDESELLKQLSGNDVSASGPQCLEFIRTSANLLMNLAGIAYTNCLNAADDQMFNELSRISDLQLTREQYNQFNLLGAFRGENIFIDPSKIRQKMTARMQARVNLPTLTPETMAALKAAFNETRVNFGTCMASAQGKLASNLNHSSLQVRAICAAEASKPN